MTPTRPERVTRPQSAFAGVTRVGLRVAVVAGVAGAAWALSASAANAAETNTPGATDLQPPSLTSSVITLVSDTATALGVPIGHPPTVAGHAATADQPTADAVTLGRVKASQPAPGDQHALRDASPTDTASVLAPVDGILTSAAEPLLGSASHILSEVLAPTNTVLHSGTAVSHLGTPTNRRAVGAGDGAATSQVVALTSGGGDAPAGTAAAYVASDDLVRTVIDTVAPLGLGDLVQAPLRAFQPMIGIADQVLAPLAVVLRPVTATVRMVLAPVTTVLGPVMRPVLMIVLRSTAGLIARVTGTVAMTRDPVIASMTPSHEATRAVDAATIAMTPVRVEAGTSAQRAYDRAVTRGTPEASQRGRRLPEAPVLPVSSPGAIPTMMSGSHSDGGSPAILSTPVVNGSVEPHRLLTATGVVARQLLVEAPTASPD
jgi:hypothetical protein